MTVRPPRGRWHVVAEVTGLGLELAVAFGLATWLGARVDAALGTAPGGVLAGVFLGLLLGGVILRQTMRRLER